MIDIWPLGVILVHFKTSCFSMIFDAKGYIWVFWYFGWEHLGDFNVRYELDLDLGECHSWLQKRKNVRFSYGKVIQKRNGDIFQWGGRQVKKTAKNGRFLDFGGSRWKMTFLSNVPLMPQDNLVPFLGLLRHFCNWEIFFEGIYRPYFGTLGPSEGS